LNGRLIVLEGLDGSGKATQTGELFRRLQEAGARPNRLSFPDYQSPSSALVQMYLNGEFGDDPSLVNAYGASSFYAVDRYASYLRFWKREYDSGGLFLADRYTTSNAVYQMAKLPRAEWANFLAWLGDYEYGKLGLPQPDRVIFLDMPTEVSQKLMSARYQGNEALKDLHERNLPYLQKCREAAYYAAEKGQWKVVPCAQGGEPLLVQQVHKMIWEVVQSIC
jgi:dTMP kinase